MKKLLFISFIILLWQFSAYAQLKIWDTGNIGIDTENPVSKFAIGTPGDSYSKLYFYNSNSNTSSRALVIKQKVGTGWGWYYGSINTLDLSNPGGKSVSFYSSNYTGDLSTGWRFGIKARAGNGDNGVNYGLFAELAGSRNGTAIFATIPGRGEALLSAKWAGYFRGNVFIEDDLTVDGVFHTSDNKLKKDIRKLDNDNLAKLKQISAIKYNLKTPDEVQDYPFFDVSPNDTATLAISNDLINSQKYKKEKIGLSAQELQQFYPELVKEDESGYLSVNYTGLVPVLIEAIKEQQMQIEAMQKELTKLKLEKTDKITRQ